MKRIIALNSILLVATICGCMNEVKIENATIVIINNASAYPIDTVRIYYNTNYDRSKDNLLGTSENIAISGGQKSFTVMAGISYYVEVRYSDSTYFSQSIDALTKGQTVNIYFSH
jgi:hypothetical protein